MLDARVLSAARKEKREHVHRLIRGKDFFEACAILLAEIAGEP